MKPPEGYELFTPKAGESANGCMRYYKDASDPWELIVDGGPWLSAASDPKTPYLFARRIKPAPPSLDPKGDIGATKAPLWLLPPVALEVASWAHKHGADKYGLFNWRENKVCASTYISAMMRHLNAWRDGEDNDPDSRVSHLAHIIASANILLP